MEFDKEKWPRQVSEEVSDSLEGEVTWTAEEEKRVRRKIDRVVMPLLMCGFFALQLDRGNIGNAKTDHFTEDVNISPGVYNVGQQLFAVGVVIWEIPSQMILYRLGPSIWMSALLLCWGLVATFQAFQHGTGIWLTTRFLIGSFESGFAPGAFYTITRWYKAEELSKRFALFYLGNMFVQALGSDMAYGILQMGGVAGLYGWQWLFIIEGLLTIAAGCLFLLFFPDSPSNPVCFSRIQYFNDNEIKILVQRVSNPIDPSTTKTITTTELKNTLTNWKLIPHVLFTICGLSPLFTFQAYGPSLVESWGDYGTLAANAWASIGPWCQIPVAISLAFVADRTGLRGPVVLIAGFLWWLFMLTFRVIINDPNSHTRFGVLTVAFAFSQVWHPINGSWMALNARTPGEKSITMAILIMAANTAGIMGPQFFQNSDAPVYEHGFTIIVAMLSVALFAMCWANLQYFLLNRRAKKEGSCVPYQQ